MNQWVAGLLGFLFLSAGALAEPFLAEASGICRVGGAIVIVGDETPDALWVKEDPAAKVKLRKVNDGDWDDMEDLAEVNDHQFFGITSHSRTKKGNRKPEREELLLFARSTSQFAVEDYWSLRKPILTALEKTLGQVLDLEKVQENPPKEGGLNVEGLAYRGGQLFLGLRSPLTSQGDAILLRIKNGKALLEGEDPQISDVMTLPLGKRGIRGMTTYRDGILLIAGSADADESEFGLYRWTEATQSIHAFPLAGFSQLLRPEGLMVDTDGSFLFVQDFEEPTQQEVVVRLGKAKGFGPEGLASRGRSFQPIRR